MNNKHKIFFLVFTLLFTHIVFAARKIPRVIVAPEKKTHRSKLLTPTIKKIITHKQIKASGAHKVSQLLQAVSGVQLQDMYGDGSRVAVGMRGFGDNAFGNTLILLNGLPLINPSIAPVNFNDIPVSDVKQIEIIPGSAGVLYGDQAVGGVINIVTKEPKKHQRHAEISYGSYNTQKYQLSFGDVFDNGFGYRISAQHDRTNNYRRHNRNKLNNISVLITKKFSDGNFYLQYRNIDNDLQFPGYEQPDDRRAAKNNVDFNNQNRNILLGGLEKNLNENWKFKIDSLFRNLHGYGLYDSNLLISSFKERQDAFALRPKVIGMVNLFNTSLMSVFGIDYLNGRYKYDSVSYFYQAKQEEFAGYGQLTAPLKDNFDLVVGARSAVGSSNASSGTATNYATITNAGLFWHLNNHSQIFVQRAGSYRFPKADELALSKDNKLLKTQTGASYETGYRFGNERTKLLLDAYQLNLKNEILYVPDVGTPFPGRNENLEPTVRRGFIASFGYALLQNWHLSFDYNFVHAKFNAGNDKGKWVPFVAKNTFKVVSDYKFLKCWGLAVEGIYIGSRYPATDVQNIAKKLSGYAVLNANINYYHKPFTFSLRCNNITNKYYDAYATTQYIGSSYSTYFYPAPGRNFLFTVAVDVV
ncbi:MAG: TonB-dependent receptor [Gammaproteobacteria bacterium]|jgi:iron complex outermembrane receptor protein